MVNIVDRDIRGRIWVIWVEIRPELEIAPVDRVVGGLYMEVHEVPALVDQERL